MKRNNTMGYQKLRVWNDAVGQKKEDVCQ